MKMFKLCLMFALSTCIVSCDLLGGSGGEHASIDFDPVRGRDGPFNYSFEVKTDNPVANESNIVDARPYYSLSKVNIKLTNLGPVDALFGLSVGMIDCDEQHCGIRGTLANLDAGECANHKESTHALEIGQSCGMSAIVGGNHNGYMWHTGKEVDNPLAVQFSFYPYYIWYSGNHVHTTPVYASPEPISVISVLEGHAYGGDADPQFGHFLERQPYSFANEMYPDESGGYLYFVTTHVDDNVKTRLLMYPVSYPFNAAPIIGDHPTQIWLYDNQDPDIKNCWIERSRRLPLTCLVAGVIDHKIAVMQQPIEGGLGLYFNDKSTGTEKFYQQNFLKKELQQFSCDDSDKVSCFFRAGDGELYLRGMPYKWDKELKKFVRIDWLFHMGYYIFNVIPVKGHNIYLIQKAKDDALMCVDEGGINPRPLTVTGNKVGSSVSFGKYSWWQGLAIDPVSCSTVNKNSIGNVHLFYGSNHVLQEFAVPHGIFRQHSDVPYPLLFYPYPPKGFLNDE